MIRNWMLVTTHSISRMREQTLNEYVITQMLHTCQELCGSRQYKTTSCPVRDDMGCIVSILQGTVSPLLAPMALTSGCIVTPGV